MRRDFVLVHGMSHGGWAWASLAERLERAGHRVIAPDLPGHGRRAHERRRASVHAYARAVADAMILAGMTDAVVVGHSMGGVVIPKVAELVESRVGHLVFLAAVVLPDGGSMLDVHLGPATGALLRGLAAAGDGAVQYPAALEWSRWLGDMPPGDERVVDALGRMTPQPFRPVAERVSMRRFHAMRVPRTYIRCLRDAAVPPARAARYAARLGVTPIDLDTAHNPMMSAPDRLAKILTSL
ncbi:MAG TPA: alpha/beta fold hydrolase [Candidatus Tectomicrobia bacterium]|nr:alpha/beta fold hydrolase [Candidatus Tectomicrobia bacterium]